MEYEEETIGSSPKNKDVVSALKKKVSEHMASVAKDFQAVTPENYMLEEKEHSQRLYLPCFELKQKDIPESKNWEVGKRYQMMIEVEMTAVTDRIGSEPEVKFDIVGVKTDSSKGKK